MTRPDPTAEDLVVRAAMRELAPRPEPNFDAIDARAAKYIRRGRIRLGVSIGLMAVAGAIIVPLASSHSDGRVQVTSHRPRPPAATVPTTGAHRATTTVPVSQSTGTLPQRHDSEALPIVSPTTALPVTRPTVTPRVTTPVTNPEQNPKTTTTTTIAPVPDLVLVTLILDDTGLHAPATVVAAGDVKIRFFDERSEPREPKMSVRVDTTCCEDVTLFWSWSDVYGEYGMIYGPKPVSGVVTFTVLDYATQHDAGLAPASTTFVAH